MWERVFGCSAGWSSGTVTVEPLHVSFGRTSGTSQGVGGEKELNTWQPWPWDPACTTRLCSLLWRRNRGSPFDLKTTNSLLSFLGLCLSCKALTLCFWIKIPTAMRSNWLMARANVWERRIKEKRNYSGYEKRNNFPSTCETAALTEVACENETVRLLLRKNPQEDSIWVHGIAAPCHHARCQKHSWWTVTGQHKVHSYIHVHPVDETNDFNVPVQCTTVLPLFLVHRIDSVLWKQVVSRVGTVHIACNVHHQNSSLATKARTSANQCALQTATAMVKCGRLIQFSAEANLWTTHARPLRRRWAA